MITPIFELLDLDAKHHESTGLGIADSQLLPLLITFTLHTPLEKHIYAEFKTTRIQEDAERTDAKNTVIASLHTEKTRSILYAPLKD